MIDFSQKSIIVTGGASGIGAAVCEAAYKEGAHIGIIDINEKAASKLCQHLGDRAFFASGDVESENSMEVALTALSAVMPPFNGCITSAGIMPTREPMEELPFENFKRVQSGENPLNEVRRENMY